MTRKGKYLAQGAMIAALYAALTHLQNFLLPGSASWAIQFRASEALGVFAFFTPAAIPGLSIGCLVYNISAAGVLPLDFLLGTLATLLAAWGMYFLREVKVKKYPLLGMLLPAVTNAVLVGWELSVYIGGAFWVNAAYVALGEVAVMLTLGSALYYSVKKRGLDKTVFR